eukprot:g1892.t1
MQVSEGVTLTAEDLERNVARKNSALGLGDIQVLSIQRQQLNSLGNAFHACVSLRELDLGRNRLTSLQGLQFCKNLESLSIYYNKIKEFDEIRRLQSNPRLQVLDCRVNPVSRQSMYRCFVCVELPQVNTLDEIEISQFMRERAPEVLKREMKLLQKTKETSTAVNQETRKQNSPVETLAETVGTSMEDKKHPMEATTLQYSETATQQISTVQETAVETLQVDTETAVDIIEDEVNTSLSLIQSTISVDNALHEKNRQFQQSAIPQPQQSVLSQPQPQSSEQNHQQQQRPPESIFEPTPAPKTSIAQLPSVDQSQNPFTSEKQYGTSPVVRHEIGQVLQHLVLEKEQEKARFSFEIENLKRLRAQSDHLADKFEAERNEALAEVKSLLLKLQEAEVKNQKLARENAQLRKKASKSQNLEMLTEAHASIMKSNEILRAQLMESQALYEIDSMQWKQNFDELLATINMEKSSKTTTSSKKKSSTKKTPSTRMAIQKAKRKASIGSVSPSKHKGIVKEAVDRANGSELDEAIEIATAIVESDVLYEDVPEEIEMTMAQKRLLQRMVSEMKGRRNLFGVTQTRSRSGNHDMNFKLSASAEAVFKKIDSDESGYLSKQEFAEALHDLGLGFKDEEVESLFDAVDADNSGSVSFPEFKAITKETLRILQTSPTKKRRESKLKTKRSQSARKAK